MITKAQVKHIQSLDDKKYRTLHQQFVVEGEKMVEELLSSNLKIRTIFATKEWFSRNEISDSIEVYQLELYELERISFLKTPHHVLATAMLPKSTTVQFDLALLLDDLQDPGNLGSIIRIADWYNIQGIYCSEKCVDAFNTKVIQASMGSIFRVQVQKCDLLKLVTSNKDIPSYAATFQGTDINSFTKIKKGFIIIGNESKGINEALIKASTNRISILKKGKAESLNAAVATGIICHCLLS
jgi:TrmH family RNA methyltransferase